MARSHLGGGFDRRTAILTCGPREHLSAFKREATRHSALRLVEIEIKALDSEERARYHEWYESFTGATVPRSKESIILVVAWIYELQREQQITPDQFAHRFDDRLDELRLREVGRTALSLNLYGLLAPDTLFQAHRPAMEQLLAEGVWRLSSPSLDSFSGRFFHPAVCRLIYEALVPASNCSARAADMARGFDAMLSEGAPADAFLGWLGTAKIGRRRTKGAATLDENIRRAILTALWDGSFAHREPTEHVVNRLSRWHYALVSGEIGRPPAAPERIRAWWDSLTPDDARWPRLFEMVWDNAEQAARTDLRLRGQAWLQTASDDLRWPWIFQRLARDDPQDPSLRALGRSWLAAHPADLWWSLVWIQLATTAGDGSDRGGLIRLALHAIPHQPDVTADRKVWDLVEQLGAPETPLVDAIVRKLSAIANPYKHHHGVEFLQARIPRGKNAQQLDLALASTLDGAGWAYLWQELLKRLGNVDDLLPWGWRWRDGREDRPEWSHVWRKLIEHDEARRGELIEVGRAWLDGREDRPEWNYVWQKLVEHDHELDVLLPWGRRWLEAHPAHDGAPKVGSTLEAGEVRLRARIPSTNGDARRPAGKG